MTLSIGIPDMPSAEEADIAALAVYWGRPLPFDFEEFLRRHDGACPDDNMFDAGPDQQSGVRCFIPAHEMLQEAAEIEGFRGDVLPFASDDCGNYVYLDPGTGKVFFWDHEVEDGDIPLAPTFADFLKILKPCDKSSIVTKPVHVIRSWIDPGFKPEFE